jgi:uncharacterized protein (DUF1697 family)
MSGNRKAGDVHVALLRGVNVGGKNRLPMKDLAALFVGAGCSDVVTSVARSNPFLRAGADAETLHVAFLADRPSPERVASLDRGRSPPDELEVQGREIYLSGRSRRPARCATGGRC